MRWQTDPILTVDHLSMRFEALVAVNDLVVHGRARRDHGPHRSERRRQDHRLQLHHRLLKPTSGRIALAHGAARRTSADIDALTASIQRA